MKDKDLLAVLIDKLPKWDPNWTDDSKQEWSALLNRICALIQDAPPIKLPYESTEVTPGGYFYFYSAGKVRQAISDAGYTYVEAI